MIYFDTSALIKLVYNEAESDALEQWLLLQDDTIATSVVGQIELLRVCRRVDPAGLAAAGLLLADISIIPLAGWIIETAENIGAPSLRTLDALHLASAFGMGDALSGFVAYDKRLRDAALLIDLPVMIPGVGN